MTAPLVLHDVHGPGDPRHVASRAIHGGVRSLPFVFDHTIRVAAVLGLTKRPGLLLRLRR